MKINGSWFARLRPKCHRPSTPASLRKLFIGTIRRVVPAVIVLLFNPFQVLDSAADTSNNIILAATAPFYPMPQKAVDRAQDRITTILFRQDDLDGTAFQGLKSWPPTLDHYATLLRKIAKYGPTAIYLDLNIGPHNSEDRANFHNVLKHLNDRIPIYVAVLPEGDDATTQPVHPLDISADHMFDDAISGRILGEWQGFRDHYPLWIPGADRRWHLTPAPLLWLADLDRREKAAKETATPFPDEDAKTLAWLKDLRDNNRIDGVPSEAPPPMVVRWGSSMPQDMAKLGLRDTHCLRAAEGAWFPRLKTALAVLARGLSPSDEEGPAWNLVTQCPHHVTLSVKDVLRLTRTELNEDSDAATDAFHDRIILVGADVTGLNDNWPSPVHGKVQGVLLHAMVLDNLLNLGRSYITDVPHIIVHCIGLIVEIMAVLLASVAVHRPAQLLLDKAEGETNRQAACDLFILTVLLASAALGLAAAAYGGLSWRTLILPTALWGMTCAVALSRSWWKRWLHTAPERAWARVCLRLCVTAISGLGAFTIFIILSFGIVIFLFLEQTTPAPWLFIVTVSLYATLGEPLLEAIEHLLGPEPVASPYAGHSPPSPHSS